jgi:hypothetical protein
MEVELQPLLEGEKIHPALALDCRGPDEGGWRVVATAPIAAGTVLLRSYGVSLGPTSSMVDAVTALCGANTCATGHGGAAIAAVTKTLRDRLQLLHPRTAADCPDGVRANVGAASTADSSEFGWLHGEMTDESVSAPAQPPIRLSVWRV